MLHAWFAQHLVCQLQQPVHITFASIIHWCQCSTWQTWYLYDRTTNNNHHESLLYKTGYIPAYTQVLCHCYYNGSAIKKVLSLQGVVCWNKRKKLAWRAQLKSSWKLLKGNWLYLHTQVLIWLLTKGHTDIVINHFWYAIQDNLHYWLCPLKCAPSSNFAIFVLLIKLACS